MCLSRLDRNTPKLSGAPVMGPLKSHSDLETENYAKSRAPDYSPLCNGQGSQGANKGPGSLKNVTPRRHNCQPHRSAFQTCKGYGNPREQVKRGQKRAAGKKQKGTQPFVDPRLRTRSRIEAQRRPPQGQRGQSVETPLWKEKMR